MSMYQITPTFPADFEVHPKKVCYKVSSYHNNAAEQQSIPKQESDPRKDLQQKQQVLIERLKAQTESLNKLLVNLGKTAGDKKAAPSKPEKATPISHSAEVSETAGKEGKKDKDAKKEARKAAKAEAMKKVASGEAPAAKGKSPKVEQANGWTVEDDRKTWETNLSLTVNIPTPLVNYPQEHLGQIVLTISAADKKWAAILSKVGEKRHVAFNGDVCNKAKDAKTTVKVTNGKETTVTFDKTTVKTLQTVWKVLGSALGLYSRRPQQVLAGSHQALWLQKSEQIIRGSGDLSFATREASQFLARFDSLSSQWEVSVADLVFRSLLDQYDALPNNVEIWAKKIDKLVS